MEMGRYIPVIAAVLPVLQAWGLRVVIVPPVAAGLLRVRTLAVHPYMYSVFAGNKDRCFYFFPDTMNRCEKF